MDLLETLRSHVLALPELAKFAIVLLVIAAVPMAARRVRLPEMVGLLLFGVLLGPHVLGFFGTDRPIADFFAELGKLLLMFAAGLEIDVDLFRKVQTRSIVFGLITTGLPLLLGTLFGLASGYATILIVTGFLIDPVAFVGSIVGNLPLVVGIIAALLVGKGIAAAVAGRAFGYPSGAQLTMWALTLPQVAATLAATLVAYNTRNATGERMRDGTMLNVVLVLMLITSVLGLLLAERFAPRMFGSPAPARAAAG